MTQPSRLSTELADALGLTQAVRAAAADAASRAPGRKVRARLGSLDPELARLQERVNALVVAGPPAERARLAARSRRLRDSEADAQEGRPDDADALDAVQALVGETAFALSQWRVVRRLAKAAGDKPARKLAKEAVAVSRVQLEVALDCADRVVRRQAKALDDQRPAG